MTTLRERFAIAAATPNHATARFLGEVATEMDRLDKALKYRAATDSRVPIMVPPGDRTFSERWAGLNGRGDEVNLLRDIAAALDDVLEWAALSNG